MTPDQHPEPGPVEFYDVRLARWMPLRCGRYPHRAFTPLSRYSRVGSHQR